jgi:diguanylate cyclase (GGDEF)-like protein
MRRRRSTPAAVLALLYGVSGVMCLVGAARPMHAHTPVALLTVLGVIGLAGCVTLWTRGPRLGAVGTHAALGLITVLTGVLAWRSVTAVGVIGLAPVMLAVVLFTGHFLPHRAARLHMAAMLTGASVGAWAAAPSGFGVAWLNLVLGLAAVAETQVRLAQGLRTAATTDPLTGVANRRAWETDAERHLAHAARTGEPVTIAILDLDNFKEVNDRQGHGAGDALLRDLTSSWRSRLRRADALGRYGGDEFVLCLPATDEAGARELLEQLESTHEFTWSAGAATARDGDTLAAMLDRADADLYADKKRRRATGAMRPGASTATSPARRP